MLSVIRGDTSVHITGEQSFEGYPERTSGAEEHDAHIELMKAGGATASHAKVMHPKNETMNLEREAEGQLTIDVYQTPSEIIIESAVAGVEPDDLDIDVTTDSVTIRGERRRGKEVKDDDYFYQECYWGRFSRSVILPQEIDAENSYASFKNGILTVHMPKLKRERSKKVKVKLE